MLDGGAGRNRQITADLAEDSTTRSWHPVAILGSVLYEAGDIRGRRRIGIDFVSERPSFEIEVNDAEASSDPVTNDRLGAVRRASAVRDMLVLSLLARWRLDARSRLTASCVEPEDERRRRRRAEAEGEPGRV